MAQPDALLWRRWDDVDRVLTATMDLPSERRVEHVNRLLVDDVELRDLVLRLLQHVNRGGEVQPGSDVVLAAFSLGALDDVAVGDEIGRYRIISRLGRGGMATVYEAERSDGAYEQRVALKVLRRGLDTDDLVRRFLTERQVLSSLAHPNIARMLDGGSTETGRPYLVMELVAGETITVWADQRRLDVAARLRLFLSVADAVQSAHRQLIVHRDIKPSNVLVSTDGNVKLLDFGIAKLLDRDDELTGAESVALTPQYASPEQLNGGAITTGTDVYQLGLLLGELLTGLPPRAGVANTGEPPEKPSRAAGQDHTGCGNAVERAAARSTTPERLVRTLRGDLDIMVGKATRDEPAHRYASVVELAADVQRYLDGHPIAAHPESAAYTARKFIGRHPLFLPGAIAASLTIVSFIATLTVQNIRVGRERDYARAASNQALATQEFLVNLLRTPDPTTSAATIQNPGLTVGEALERGRARINRELGNQPDVKAAILVAMGRTYSGLGRWLTADTLLRESLRIVVERHGEGSPPMVPSLLALADNYRNQRDHRQADSLYHGAARILEGMTRDGTLATALQAMSGTQRDLGAVDSSVALANRALEVRRSLGDTSSVDYVGTLAALGYALRGAQQLDSAEVLYRLVIGLMERDSTAGRENLAVHHNNLAFLLRLKEDYVGAVESYRKALAIATETLGSGHVTTQLVRQNLAGTLELAGRSDEAADIGRAQVVAAEAEWPGGHWRVGAAHMALGRLLLRMDRSVEALPSVEAGHRSFAETLGPRHEWTLLAQADLGTAKLLGANDPGGVAALNDAIRRLGQLTNVFGADARVRLTQLATVLESAGRTDLARPIRDLLARNPA